MYAYVGGDAINRRDPTGLTGEECTGDEVCTDPTPIIRRRTVVAINPFGGGWNVITSGTGNQWAGLVGGAAFALAEALSEHVDRGLENLCNTLSKFAGSVDEVFEEAEQNSIIKGLSTSVRDALPWKSIEFSGGGGNGLGLGAAFGLSVHPDGQYYVFARGGGGAYGGGDASVTFSYSANRPGGIGIDGGLAWPGRRISGGFSANSDSAGFKVQTGMSFGSSFSFLFTYTGAKNCGNLNE